MQKIIIVHVLILISISTLSAQKQNFTFEQVYEGQGDILYNSIPYIETWIDDQHYLMQEMNQSKISWKQVEAESGNATDFGPLEAVNTFLPDDLKHTSPTAHDQEYNYLIYRKAEKLIFADRINQNILEITDSEKIKNPRFSPNGEYIAFTRDHNLFVMNAQTQQVTQLTFDGAELIYNGWASWVYMEEILGRRSNYAAFWWSPNSEKIAFLRFDDRPVPEFPIYVAEGVHGYLEEQRYPKSGDVSPIVKLGIADVGTGETVWVDINENFEYTAWPFWTPDSKELWFQQMNRDQDHLVIYSADPATGDKKLIYTETQDAWVEFFEDITFLLDRKGVILRSDQGGWRHLYLYDMQGNLIKQLTKGDWAVNSIELVDHTNGEIYFMGNKGATTDNYLFKINVDGSDLTNLTPEPGIHSCEVSPSGDYIIDTYSNINQPTTEVIRNKKGEILKTLGTTYHANVDQYAMGKVELFTIPSTDGYNLPTLWVLPPDFDESKKYPIIYQIYSGPGSARVRNSYQSYSNHFWAQQGIIVITVDHRGSGHFGKKGMEMMHRNLGKWEMHDLIESVKWLQQKPFVDASKIGITGGSYGGYTTCMALTYGADYFTHGVARASVTDWRLYDNVYTERYMDHPEDNPEGYNNGSVMAYASKLEGKLLLTHGTSDDNVHMQNTVQLVDKLIEEEKQFDFMLYPYQRHGFRGKKRTHSNRLAARFWFEHFLDKPTEIIDFQENQE